MTNFEIINTPQFNFKSFLLEIGFVEYSKNETEVFFRKQFDDLLFIAHIFDNSIFNLSVDGDNSYRIENMSVPANRLFAEQLFAHLKFY